MRASFISAFLVGLVGVLVAAYFVPWAQHERVASLTSVAINGGRRETFLVHLPADRLVTVADTDRFPATVGTTLPVPESLSIEPLVLEHFKLRNSAGTVIGLAVRHWSADPTGPVSVWSLSIPSRGTLLLRADGNVPASLAGAMAGAGIGPDRPPRDQLEVVVAAESESASVLSGTEEFIGVRGRYTETWRISGFNDQSELQGTIVIDTIVNQT